MGWVGSEGRQEKREAESRDQRSRGSRLRVKVQGWASWESDRVQRGNQLDFKSIEYKIVGCLYTKGIPRNKTIIQGLYSMGPK